MEKSATSPVANVISNGDKRSCSCTLGKKGKKKFCRLGKPRSQTCFQSLGSCASPFCLENRVGKWHGSMMRRRACVYSGKARVWAGNLSA